VLALREDPSYFADAVQADLDHEFKNILVSDGDTSSCTDEPAITAVLQSILTYAYLDVIHWDVIHEQFNKLDELRRHPSAGGSNEESIKFLLVTHCMLRNAAGRFAGLMGTFVESQPTFRS
jgi:hypothetical protein